MRRLNGSMVGAKYNNVTKERFLMLDFLRGIALMGICLANFPEFSLYTFQPPETTAAMPTARIDTVVKYLQLIFIDGKFYTIFSVLFGIGFSIFLSNALKKNRNGLLLFYRRMIVLLFIGLFHLICLWAGDILILYAFLGLFLPLFRTMSDKKLLITAVILLLFPILVDSCIAFFGWNLSAPVISATQHFHAKAGITKENFPVWLVEAKSYKEALSFNFAGSFIRMQEFIEGNRAFKVMGLFIIGFYIGRQRIYARLSDYTSVLKNIRNIGFMVGLPLSVLYAWNAMNGYPCALPGSAALYAFSVFPLSFAYISAICLIYLKYKSFSQVRNDEKNNFITKDRAIYSHGSQVASLFKKIASIIAATGRMALTNYLMQSVFGIFIFYGFGLGFGARTGLVHVEWIALAVFLVQMVYSSLWLRYFRFGPIEWGWRMLTYGEWLSIQYLSVFSFQFSVISFQFSVFSFQFLVIHNSQFFFV